MTDLDLSQYIVNSHWSDLLLALGKYEEGQYQFALSATYEQFWETCPKGEWLLHWIAKEKSTDHKLIVHTACQCARLALPYCKDKQQRPLKCIETTEKWCRGEATSEEVKQARSAAWEACSAGYTASAAAYAAYAASAAGSAASASYAASTAAAAASASAASAASAAASASAAYHAAPKNKEAAYQKRQLQTANLVRSLITRPDKMVEEYEHILKLKAFL